MKRPTLGCRNIDRISLHPQRMPQVQRHEQRLATKYRRQVQAFANVRRDGLVKAAYKSCGEGAQIERTDMHGHFDSFKVQKGGIQSGK